MEKRIIVRIEITPGARTRLDECWGKSGMTQVSMISRLVEWFAKQPQMVQSFVLGHIPAKLEVDVARIALKELEKAGRNRQSKAAERGTP